MAKAKEEQSAGDYWANVLGVLFLIVVVVGFVAQHWMYFVIPLAMVVGGCAAYFHFSSNAYHLKIAWRESKRVYDSLRVQYKELTLCPPDKIRIVATELLKQDGIDVTQPSAKWYVNTVSDLYRKDYRGGSFPVYPSLEATRDQGHLASIIDEARTLLDHSKQEVARADLTMDLVKRVVDDPWEFRSTCSDSGPFTVRMLEMVPDIRDMITGMSAYFFLPKYWDLGVGEWLREKYLRNVHDASLNSKTEGEIERTGNVVPDEFEGTNQEVAEAYLGGTPFLEAFAGGVPWGIPEKLRPEHGVIVAGTGGGKTQLLEAMVLADLEQDDPPGILVIDSKGEMLERIARLRLFDPDGGGLHDRLLIIDHKDKPALNLFDVDPEAVEQRFNQVESLMKYFFSSLFDSKTSDQMDTLLIPLLHIVLRKEGATLRTLVELVRNPRAYPDMLDRIPPDSKDFIINQYADTFYDQTKSAIITRLSRLTQDTALSAIFTAPSNAVDLARALNDGKIVLVNTDAEGLGPERSATFGRYFIAQAYNAGLSRGSRQGQQRRPIHVYIDECAPYLDNQLSKMLTTIRSYGVGVMMAFQGEWQMKGYESVIQGNTSTKILGHLRNVDDAKLFAANMNTTVEFLMSQRKDTAEPPQYGCFGCYTTDLNRTIGIQVPFYQLDKRGFMSDEAYRRSKESNRKRVSEENTAEALQRTLRSHFSIAGPLFGQLEAVAIQAGGKDAVGKLNIDALVGILTAGQRRTFHTLRLQRNQLTHRSQPTDQPTPIPDIRWWEEQVKELLAILLPRTTPPPKKPNDPTEATRGF